MFVSSEEILGDLEAAGYVKEPIYRFELIDPPSGATYFSNQGQFGRTNFGGPNFDNPIPPESFVTVSPTGEIYTYVQYMSPQFSTCNLLFFVSQGNDNKLIGSVDIAELNERIHNVVISLEEDPLSPLICLPYGWQDVNNNGKPDMPVTILWENNYTGGEVHIFEVNDDNTIVDLVANLPGPVYHWEFDPEEPSLLLVDLVWARHDCLYPSSPFGFWIYEWNGDAYVDVTSEYSYSEYLSFIESLLTPGRPFIPEAYIGPLVSLLLTYDYSGQRDLGWKKFLEFADIQNWPDTSPEYLAWLKDDVTHFTKEYEAGLAFTPNDANCSP